MTVRIYCQGESATATFKWARRKWICDHCGAEVRIAW